MTRRLIIRPGAMGDFLVSLPAMERLRADYTEVWTTGANVALARFADHARSITAAGLNRLGIVEADDVVEILRGFDSVVSWYGTNRPEFREFVEARNLPFTFHAALPVDAAMHAADYFLAQVGGAPGGIPQVKIPAAGRGDYAVVHPFSGSARKNWPEERYRELAARLHDAMPVKWCRGPEDTLEGAACIPDLYDLACWLGRARVFVGNDSGVTHLAAAAGTPVVALFGAPPGASDARVWAPRGPGARVIERATLRDISVDDVAEAVEQAIG